MAVWGLAAIGCGRIRFDPVQDSVPDTPADAALSAISQQAYIKASNTGAGDGFGERLALSADGSTLAVGAPYEDSAAMGIDGNQADNSAMDAGAVYVFARAGTTWTQQAYLKATNAGAGDAFGFAVALSADGSTLAVGAPDEDSAAPGIDGNQGDNTASNAGAAYVFTRVGGTWTQDTYVKASNTGAGDLFGYSVALSADGSTLAVSGTGESSAATGIDGNQTDNSAAGAGAAYVFVRNGGSWMQQAYVKASNTDAGDAFGDRCVLSGDGSTLVVDAFVEDSAATGIDGNQADNSALDSGAVYVFARSGTTWSQQAYVKASNTDAGDHFGEAIAVSADGSTIAVGADLEDSNATGIDGNQADNSDSIAGAVYVFTRTGTTWAQQAYVKASNTRGDYGFAGRGVGLSSDGSTLVVGEQGDCSGATGIDGNQTDTSAGGSGALLVFTRTAGMWAQTAYVKASNTGAGDNLGFSAAISADASTVAVSALQEASAATGIDGNQTDNSAAGAGAVYVFH